MSIIYDALRKLDRDKSSRHGRIANIAAEILKPDFSPPRKKASLQIAVILFTAMVTAALTYVVLVKWRFDTKPSPSTTVKPVAVNPITLSRSSDLNALPQSSPPATNQPIALDLPFHEVSPDIHGKTNPLPSTPKMRTPSTTQKTSTSPVKNKEKNLETDQSIISEEPALIPEKTKISSENIPVGPPLTPSPLNISAVIWYEEPSRRFAMINGGIVREGAVVEGMKIEEIFPNRVRFSHDGQYIEIPVQ